LDCVKVNVVTRSLGATVCCQNNPRTRCACRCLWRDEPVCSPKPFGHSTVLISSNYQTITIQTFNSHLCSPSGYVTHSRPYHIKFLSRCARHYLAKRSVVRVRRSTNVTLVEHHNV